MKKSLNISLLFASMLLSTVIPFSKVAAQSDCPCCTILHSQFDFWVGEWVVFDSAGNKVGENNIEKLEHGCLISEHWQSTSGGSGRSFNYVDISDSTWHQVWVDSHGGQLELKGRAGKDVMTLAGELLPGQKVDFYRNRITWTKNTDGSVTQLWEILDKYNHTLKTVFKGIYRKK